MPCDRRAEFDQFQEVTLTGSLPLDRDAIKPYLKTVQFAFNCLTYEFNRARHFHVNSKHSNASTSLVSYKSGTNHMSPP